MRSKIRFAVQTSIVALSLGFGNAAYAQADAAAADDSAAAADKEIVVTGSLIQRPNNTAVSRVSPVKTVIRRVGMPGRAG